LGLQGLISHDCHEFENNYLPAKNRANIPGRVCTSPEKNSGSHYELKTLCELKTHK
jgi:hypothetical protein